MTPILRLCIPRSGYGSGSYALLVTVTEPQFPFTRKPYLQSLIIPTDFSLSPHIPMKLSAGTSCETAFLTICPYGMSEILFPVVLYETGTANDSCGILSPCTAGSFQSTVTE